MFPQLSTYCQAHGYPGFELKTIMFDMDGVLFNSMPNHARAWHRAMAFYGLDLPEDEAYMHEGRTGFGTINIVTQRQFGRSADQAECDKIYKKKSEFFNQYPTAERMTGAYETVKAVKEAGVTPTIVTGSGTASLLGRIEQNYPNLFRHEWMVAARDVKFGKPNPEPYLMGMQKAGGLTPRQTMVVENAPLGVRAAVAARCFTIAVNTGPLPDEMLQQEGANLIFPRMTDLAEAYHCWYPSGCHAPSSTAPSATV